MKIITQLTLFLLISSAVFSQTKEVVEDTAEVKKAFSLLNIVKEADRFIARLDSTYVIDLPVGIGVKNKKNSESYAIVISELKVREGKTFLTAYMAFTVPGTTIKMDFS